jgi:hypothetical protein
MSLASLRGWRSVVVAALLVLALLLLAKVWLCRARGPHFRDVGELRTWAETRGLFCRSDRRNGKVTEGLALSSHRMSWEQVAVLCRGRPGKGPEWKEVIWAINLYSRFGVQTDPPWHGECRIWGAVIVTGDRGLLDRIEREAN